MCTECPLWFKTKSAHEIVINLLRLPAEKEKKEKKYRRDDNFLRLDGSTALSHWLIKLIKNKWLHSMFHVTHLTWKQEYFRRDW